MTIRALTVITLTGVLVGSSATAAVSRVSPQPSQAHAHAARPVLPGKADWVKIKRAAQLRNMGMARHRTAHFRVVAGTLGLAELSMTHPLAPGPCLTALQSLYGNLLDLQNAVPGENFAPLRRFVAHEPSIRACAPRQSGRER